MSGIEEIEARANAAPGGKWELCGGEVLGECDGVTVTVIGAWSGGATGYEPHVYFGDGSLDNRGAAEVEAFILHAREDIDWLIAEVRRLRRIEAAARAIADDINGSPSALSEVDPEELNAALATEPK